MSLYQHFRSTWREDHPAVIHWSGDATTYGDLHDRVGRAARWLQLRGVGPGDVVALQLPRHLRLLELHLGLMALGAATLPLNRQYTPTEVAFLVEDAGAVLLVIGDDQPAPTTTVPVARRSDVQTDDLAPAQLPAHVDDEALAVLCYTSGTTGRPKGARIPQRALRACVESLHQAWGWSRDDVLVHALPLFHIHGLFVAQLGAVRAGATAVWLERFDPRAAFDAIATHRATIFMGVPTFYHRFLQSDATPDLSSMRLFTSGSAPLPASDHERFEARFGHRILERYGMTEVGIVLSNPLDGERRPGTVGSPLPGVRLRITDDEGEDVSTGDVGEVRIAGPSVFAGYHGLPEQTAAAIGDGWMHTGDLGFRDDDGYVHLVGRMTDMIISGGLNVYPPEVEAVLRTVSHVEEVAVFGVPDPDLGERVTAAVVGDADPAALFDAARAVLAPFKCPKRIHRLDALPRNAMGKVQKARLRARYAPPVVRDATLDDLKHLVDGNVAMARETEDLALGVEVVTSGVGRVLRGEVAARYLVAERDGAVVGQLMLTEEWSDWRDATVWWIQSVWVPEPHRRTGVFRALYDAATARAKACGIAGLRLYVDKSNERAARVYERMGMDGQHYALFERMLEEA